MSRRNRGAQLAQHGEGLLFLMLRFQRATVAGELVAEGDAADPFAARFLDRQRRAGAPHWV